MNTKTIEKPVLKHEVIFSDAEEIKKSELVGILAQLIKNYAQKRNQEMK